MKTGVTLETINTNDLQARITAAIQAGSGPDIIYQSALADVSDLCEGKGKDQGGCYGQSEAAPREGQRWSRCRTASDMYAKAVQGMPPGGAMVNSRRSMVRRSNGTVVREQDA